MADRSVVVTLKANVGSYVTSMGAAAAATTQVGTAAAKTTAQGSKGMADFSKSTGLVPPALNAAAAAGAALGVATGFAVKRFADFEAAMSAVKAATGATGSEFEALSKAAIDLGADTKFSATEAAEGIEALAKAGVSTKDILGGGLKGALDLAAAGNLAVADAAEIAATALTQFRLAGSDIPHVADLIAAAAGKAQGDVGDMGMALKQAGLVASQFGLSIEETTGALAAFASAGLIGSDAGTSFRSMLLHLAAPSKESAGLMHDLGINVYNAQGQFVGLESLAGQLRSQLGGLTQAQRDAALATIFGSDAVRAANVLYQQGAGGIAVWREEVDSAGFAAKQAATRQDNLKGSFEKLRGAVDSLGISMGKAAEGPARRLIENLTTLAVVATEAAEAVSGPSSKLMGWLDSLDEFAQENNIPLLQTSLDGIGEAARRGGEGTFDLSEKQKTLIESQAELAAQLDQTSNAASGQTEALVELRDIQLEAANAADGARGAARNLEAAYDAAAEAAEKNGKTLDINTEAGRNNQEALDGVASAGRDAAKAMQENGDSTAAIQGTVQTARDNFLKLAGQMGLSAEQAGALADQLGLVPGNYTANVNVLGAETAAAKVNGLQTAINSLTGKTVYIDTVGRQFTSPTGGRSLVGGPTLAKGGSVGDAARAQGFPTGGWVSGPGTSTSDSVPAWLSNDEFVVNAAAASQNRALLEAINAGMSPSGGGGGVFAGDLYLDSGEFLGKVRGVVRSENATQARGLRVGADS